MNDKVNFLNFFIDSSKYYEELTVGGGRITEFIPAYIFIYDTETGRISYANGKFRERFKYSFFETSESFGLLTDLVYEADLPIMERALENFQKLEPHGCFSFKCRFKDRERKFRYYKNSGRVVQNGPDQPLMILFISDDITEDYKIQQHENSLHEIYRESEQLMEAGSWSLDITSRAMTCTPGIFSILGYPEHTNVMMDEEIYLGHIVPAYVEVFRNTLNRAIREMGCFDLEYAIKNTGGQIKNVMSKGRAYLDVDGILKVTAVTCDISSVIRPVIENERNLKELNRSNKELEEFAYVASHDLQEPLRKIAMYTERLVSRCGQAIDEESKQYFKRILASTENMKGLIDSLLEFSRTNGNPKSFGAVDLNTAVEKALSNLELKVEETGAEISVMPLPRVQAIAAEMEQLFTNLISNSIKFKRELVAPKVHIEVRVASTGEKEYYGLARERVYHVIDVKDNGIGFEQEYADKIFQIFHRLHGKAEYPGTGIGLAICKRIVDNHKGIIAARGVPGAGSSFTVIIPENQF